MTEEEKAQNFETKIIDRKLVGKYAFSLEDSLGSGAFGKVFKGCKKDDLNEEVAIKMIPLNLGSEEELDYLRTLMEREIQVMQSLEHPHILAFLDFIMTKNNLYIITEFCNEGDLESRKKTITQEEALIVVKQIARAMVYANEQKIIHRDIKPANILIHSGQVKIADFGFARTIDDSKMQDKMTKKIGSPLYMAPQVYTGAKYNEKCDVWSLGVLFYELIYQKPPWYGKNAPDLFRNIRKQPLNLEHEQMDKDPDDEIKDLITKMLAQEEDERIDFQGILDHEVFKRKLPKKLPKKKKN